MPLSAAVGLHQEFGTQKVSGLFSTAGPQAPSRRRTRAVQARTCCRPSKQGPDQRGCYARTLLTHRLFSDVVAMECFISRFKKQGRFFLFSCVAESLMVVFLSHVCTSVCVTETERPHTSEGRTDRLRGTEAVTQPLSPSQPGEPVLRTDGELAEGRVVRAARASVAAAGPRGRPRHPRPRAASTSRPHEDRRGP